MLDTGCFIKAEFEQCEPPVLRSRYLLASPRDLDRYVAEHAEAMRSDFQVHFPNGIIVCERSTWRTVIDQTALSTNEASHMGLVALNNSLYVTLTRPNWTMASLSMSSFGHGVIQVDAPRIQAYAMMELKASGPEAIVAVASTHVQADVME
ncbi:hypothetical protein B5M09_010642 [Aphanomyces astaci]|uniref:Uncharacterized protein n=1 Tax=Aphanomyces astaci TaxID=112090 RepID=A0A425CTL6_APHAT|nr:hypothetical protein B5M09_010642 [Aphanomyces astaci]